MANTVWGGFAADILTLQSGEFSATVKTSLDVTSVESQLTGVSWDGTNTPMTGFNNKLYLMSGQFSITIKTSRSPGVEAFTQSISWDGTDTPWAGSTGNKLYLQSAQFSATIKTSLDINGIDIVVSGISYDGTDTPWCGTQGQKLYLQSAQFSATMKTSLSVGGVDTVPQDISWNGTDTPWAGSTGNKLYLQSAQFSATLKTSFASGDVSAIETDDVTNRLGGAVTHALAGVSAAVSTASGSLQQTVWTKIALETLDATFADMTVDSLILIDGGTVGQAAGPLMTFDDSLNQLLISGANVGIYDTNPINELSIKRSVSGGDVQINLENTSNTADSRARFRLFVGGSSAGDPMFLFAGSATSTWALGMDMSDAQKFKIAGSALLGDGNDAIVIDTSTYDIELPAGDLTLTLGDLFMTAGFVVFPKASGSGIKVDTATPTFGFADIIGDQFAKNTGGTKPVLTAYNGVINGWKFSAGDEAYMTFHIPHDYVLGTEIFLHVHWSHIGTFVNGGTVTFKATSIYAKAHNQAAFTSSPAVGTFTGTASTTQYQQILSEASYSASTPSGIQVDQDLLEPDGVIEMTFELDANNMTVSEGAVPDPFIHYVDLHYQTTGIIGTKDKAPDFYA